MLLPLSLSRQHKRAYLLCLGILSNVNLSIKRYRSHLYFQGIILRWQQFRFFRTLHNAVGNFGKHSSQILLEAGLNLVQYKAWIIVDGLVTELL